MDPNMQRAQADRWLGTAGKLLTARDFLGSKAFANRAREADPNNPVSEQILAVVDTVLAGEKRLSTSAQPPDWYVVLQLPRLIRDPELIAAHYRRLAFLLDPERNRLPFADYALQLATDAWSVLSDPHKKWLFDNELAMSLQRSELQPIRVDPVRVDPPPIPMSASTTELNTFQFFQPQSQQQQQAPVPMWQQQPQQSHREFISPPPHQPVQQLLPQWQMRDPTPAKGGERNKGSVSPMTAANQSAFAVPETVARAPTPPPPAQEPIPVSVQPVDSMPSMGRDRAPVTSTVSEYGNDSGLNANNNDNNRNPNVASTPAQAPVEENNDGDVADVESFWTACPYCFYIFEYQKIYLDCTLLCQNCRRGFHAAQISNPPPIGRDLGDKKFSFSCWSFFPIGFSMTSWKKENESQKPSGVSNWVPFSPMFSCPADNGDGNFHWFGGSGGAFGGKKNVRRRQSGLGNNAAPVVYVDDDDYLELSDSSDADSSDRDWRNPGKSKKKVVKWTGPRKRGRPPKVEKQNIGDKHLSRRGEVSVGGEDSNDGPEAEEVIVVGLAAGARTGARTDTSKNVAASVSRKQTRRTAKDMGRLDLNVEFNNEGEEHAPAVSAVNGEEDGIEAIGFFEGLDEFFSSLPILNVGGDEKAKPS